MINSIEQLEEALSRPTDAVVETVRELGGDFLLLGIAGKIGPSLVQMLKRAIDRVGTSQRVIGVSRFSSADEEAKIRASGIETIRCDLLDEAALGRLPDAPNVIYLAGMKFGSAGQEAKTWAMNTYLPAIVCKRFAGSRIVAYSTGAVYGFAPVSSGGSRETDPPRPDGEYGMSCLGRERMVEHFSQSLGTRAALIRLNYAAELRYGVLTDIAQLIREGRPVDVSMGHFNIIWQGDSNAMAIQTFKHVTSPPFFINVTGPELLRVREVAEQLAKLMDRPVSFTGSEQPTAFLSNASLAHRLFGKPEIPAAQLVEWVAHWIRNGGATLGKPTHFETRTGNY